jgi:hypothetical protein
MTSASPEGSGPAPSSWEELFREALGLIDQARYLGFAPDRWTFGGGTALMLAIDHRESRDIDIFIDDPQLLPCLAPVEDRYAFSTVPTGYWLDGTNALKIVFSHGEIDVICRPSLIADPVEAIDIFGCQVLRERPAEIVAKKIRFRGARFQPRDIFDLAAVLRGVERGIVPGGRSGLLAELEPVSEACPGAIKAIRGMAPAFMIDVMGQLMVRPGYEDLPETATSTALGFLEELAARGVTA